MHTPVHFEEFPGMEIYICIWTILYKGISYYLQIMEYSYLLFKQAITSIATAATTYNGSKVNIEEMNKIYM